MDSTILAINQCAYLRAIAHRRKAGLVIESLEVYLDGIDPRKEPSLKNTLRLLRSARVAVIAGTHELSPEVYRFLSVLQAADGEPMHKRAIADALDIDVNTCEGDEIFKRHKRVHSTFVAHDPAGNCWLKPVRREMPI